MTYYLVLGYTLVLLGIIIVTSGGIVRKIAKTTLVIILAGLSLLLLFLIFLGLAL